MNIDITWTITAVIAVSSFLSPIAVAIINNKHQAKIRALELEHDERVRMIDLKQQTIIKQLDIYYADKKDAFSNFLNAAGLFAMGKQSRQDYERLQSTIQTAMLFCSPSNYALLSNFLEYVDNIFGGGYTSSERNEYSKTLTSITTSLNEELSSTKPIIDSESSKH